MPGTLGAQLYGEWCGR